MADSFIDKNFVTKNVAMIHSDNRSLSLTDKKIANVLLKNAFEDLSNTEIHRIAIKDLSEDIGWGKDYSHSDIISSFDKLNTTNIKWNLLNEDNDWELSASTMIAGYTIPKKGFIEYSYSPQLRDLLLNPAIYARLDLLIQNSMTMKSSLNLWELLKTQLQKYRQEIPYPKLIKSDQIEIDLLKKILGVKENSYQEFKYFKRDCLLPSIKEINDKSDIFISDFEIFKKERKISSLSFIITENEVIQQALVMDDEKNEIVNELIKYGISKKEALRFIETNSPVLINKAILAVQQWCKKKKQAITPAQIKSAINGQWMPIEDKKVLKENRTDKIEKIKLKKPTDLDIKYENIFNKYEKINKEIISNIDNELSNIIIGYSTLTDLMKRNSRIQYIIENNIEV